MEEIWRDVPNYDGWYKVSNLGRLISVRFLKVKFLKYSYDGCGYAFVNLYLNGISKRHKIHQLVAECFLNHVSKNDGFVIDHIDCNNKNNRIDNLRIVTQRENCWNRNVKYTSKYAGVSLCKKSNKYRAFIYIKNKNYALGTFENEYDAHIAYQNALKNLEQ